MPNAKKTNAKRATRSKPKTQAKRTQVVLPKVKGHGDYKTNEPSTVNKIARGIGESLGGALSLIPGVGKFIPAPLIGAASSALGDAGSWLSRALGFGKYTVRRNSLVRGATVERGPSVASPPSFGTNGVGSDIVLSHREYIMDIKSSTGFATTTIPINPGNPTMFPWLSQIASLYEEFDMMGLMFEYRATSATAVGTTNAGMGVVLMATDYDCYDSNYTSKRAMEAAEFSSSAVPFETFLHPVECDRKRNVLAQQYVVPGMRSPEDAEGDERMSVLGNFTVGTEGQQTDGDEIGELWVTYHVKLSRPILESYAPTTSIYASVASGTVSDTGNLNITQQHVTGGLPGFGWAQEGTGSTARLVINNTVNKVKGTFIIRYTFFTNSADFPVVPLNLDPVFTGQCSDPGIYAGATTAKDWSTNCRPGATQTITGSGAITGAYTAQWDGPGTISIPSLHGVAFPAYTIVIYISQTGNPFYTNVATRYHKDDQLLLSAASTQSSQQDNSAAAAAAAPAAKPFECWTEQDSEEEKLYRQALQDAAATFRSTRLKEKATPQTRS